MLSLVFCFIQILKTNNVSVGKCQTKKDNDKLSLLRAQWA